MEHKITPTQLQALEAAYYFHNPHALVVGPPEDRKASMGGVRGRAGGARRRMAELLQSVGYITKQRNHVPEQDRDEWGHLTAKGYGALAPHAAKLGIDLTELRNRQEARLKVENDRAARQAVEKERQRARAEERQKQERAKTVARFRQLFKDHGLGGESFTDEQVLQFAEQAGDALFI